MYYIYYAGVVLCSLLSRWDKPVCSDQPSLSLTMQHAVPSSLTVIKPMCCKIQFEVHVRQRHHEFDFIRSHRMAIIRCIAAENDRQEAVLFVYLTLFVDFGIVAVQFMLVSHQCKMFPVRFAFAPHVLKQIDELTSNPSHGSLLITLECAQAVT